MAPGLHGPGPDSAVQLGAAGKHRRVIGKVSRMQVDRNTQVLHALPEWEIHVGVEIVAVSLAVDERALEPKLFDGTLEFRGSGGGILHGKMGEARISLRPLLHFAR